MKGLGSGKPQERQAARAISLGKGLSGPRRAMAPEHVSEFHTHLWRKGRKRHAAGVKAFRGDPVDQDDAVAWQEKMVVGQIARALCDARAPAKTGEMTGTDQRDLGPACHPQRVLR